MAGFLDGYEPVAARIERFWADHPDGQIITDLVARTDADVMFKATVLVDGCTVATGWAQETVTARGVNATSAVENCETSAIGRALANAGYATKGTARPSREEMGKTNPHAARVHALAARVKDANAQDAVKALDLVWPWDEDACVQIEALLGELMEAPFE